MRGKPLASPTLVASSPLIRRPWPLRRLRGTVGVLLLASWSLGHGQEVERLPDGNRAGGEVDFEQEVRPLFEERCYRCHGPERQRGGLRLDRAESAALGGDSGQSAIGGRSWSRCWSSLPWSVLCSSNE